MHQMAQQQQQWERLRRPASLTEDNKLRHLQQFFAIGHFFMTKNETRWNYWRKKRKSLAIVEGNKSEITFDKATTAATTTTTVRGSTTRTTTKTTHTRKKQQQREQQQERIRGSSRKSATRGRWFVASGELWESNSSCQETTRRRRRRRRRQ